MRTGSWMHQAHTSRGDLGVVLGGLTHAVYLLSRRRRFLARSFVGFALCRTGESVAALLEPILYILELSFFGEFAQAQIAPAVQDTPE